MTSSAMRSPPRTGAAMGRITSAPTPLAQSIGAIEMIVVPSVSSFGRRRWVAPPRTPPPGPAPRAPPAGPGVRGDGEGRRPFRQQLRAEAMDRPVEDRPLELGHGADARE